MVNTEIGLYDVHGVHNNPLTNKPYRNQYKNQIFPIKGDKLPGTYANLAKQWSTTIVYNHKDKIISTLLDNQIVLLTAGTGVGKTILVPRIALHALGYNDKVICTIPKRIPTSNTAKFVATCMDVTLGEEIGYYYQGTNQTNKNNIDTKLIFTTTGSLVSRVTGNDPLLKDYKCVIIDEAHERSVQTDQLLLLLKKACLKRKDLKVIIMSATIDLDRFRNYFQTNHFKFGEVDVGSELLYPIEEYWLAKMPENWFEKAANAAMKILMTTVMGDIMIFCKSSADAHHICNLIDKLVIDYRKEIKKNNKHSTKSSNILPPLEYQINPLCLKLESASTKEEQKLAIDANQYKSLLDSNGYPYTRKIVITTNVAESSITVDGIVYIIDSGYEYAESYDPNTRARSLLDNFISQSAVKQRKGRAGRTQPGYCIHLYTNVVFNRFEKYPIPDIEKSDITNDILDLMRLPYVLTVSNVRKLLSEFISPPSEKFITNSLATLYTLGAITNISPNGHITPLGYKLSSFRIINIAFARSIIASYYLGVAKSVCDIVALVTLMDFRMESLIMKFEPDKSKTSEYNKNEERRYNSLIKKYTHHTGDYLSLLKIYNFYLAALEQNHLLDKNNIIDENTVTDIGDSEANLVLETIEDEEDILNQTKNIKNIKNIKKWCYYNYLNPNILARAKRVSKQLYLTLQKTIKLYTSRNTQYKTNKTNLNSFMAVDSSITELEPQFIDEFTKHQIKTSKIMKQYTKKFISNKIKQYSEISDKICSKLDDN
jgi:pre-mRNA-splicing factor ATP-dependent RNA helicase DHX15/PRP43